MSPVIVLLSSFYMASLNLIYFPVAQACMAIPAYKFTICKDPDVHPYMCETLLEMKLQEMQRWLIDLCMAS